MRKTLLVLSLFAFLFGIAAWEEPTTELTDQEKVDAVKNALVLEGDLSAVTENLTLPETGDHGVTIEWSSTNTNLVLKAGNTYVITFDVKADQTDQFRVFADVSVKVVDTQVTE